MYSLRNHSWKLGRGKAKYCNDQCTYLTNSSSNRVALRIACLLLFPINSLGTKKAWSTLRKKRMISVSFRLQKGPCNTWTWCTRYLILRAASLLCYKCYCSSFVPKFSDFTMARTTLVGPDTGSEERPWAAGKDGKFMLRTSTSKRSRHPMAWVPVIDMMRCNSCRLPKLKFPNHRVLLLLLHTGHNEEKEVWSDNQ